MARRLEKDTKISKFLTVNGEVLVTERYPAKEQMQGSTVGKASVAPFDENMRFTMQIH